MSRSPLPYLRPPRLARRSLSRSRRSTSDLTGCLIPLRQPRLWSVTRFPQLGLLMIWSLAQSVMTRTMLPNLGVTGLVERNDLRGYLRVIAVKIILPGRCPRGAPSTPSLSAGYPACGGGVPNLRLGPVRPGAPSEGGATPGTRPKGWVQPAPPQLVRAGAPYPPGRAFGRVGWVPVADPPSEGDPGGIRPGQSICKIRDLQVNLTAMYLRVSPVRRKILTAKWS